MPACRQAAALRIEGDIGDQTLGRTPDHGHFEPRRGVGCGLAAGCPAALAQVGPAARFEAGDLRGRGFSLDLGSGVSPGAQSTIGQQGGFFDDSSFMGMQQQSMNVQQNSQQQMHYQNDMYAAPFQSSPSSMQQMGYGGGVGVGGQQSPIGNFGVGMQSMQSMQSMGVGMTASNDANNTNNQQQANDDWNDLQLQLPSDLLGGDGDLNWGVPAPNPNRQQF